jgi:putative DNA primase/helicase
MPRTLRPARSRRDAVTLPRDSEITQSKALLWLLRHPDGGAVEPRFFASPELRALAEAIVEIGPGGQVEAIIAAATSRGVGEADIEGAYAIIKAHADVEDAELLKAVREIRRTWAASSHLSGEITDDDFVRYVTLDDGLADRSEIVVITADRVEAKPTQWLWRGRIPRGKVSLVAGRPKTGKSVLLIDIAARVSRGHAMPYAERAEVGPSRVVLCMAEDDPEDMVVPRLIAAGADLGMVEIVKSVRVGRSERGLDIARDIASMERLCKTGPTSLVIIDPIMSFIGADTDTNNDASTRYALWPIKSLAERLGIAVLLNHHQRKGSGEELQETIMGSTAFAGVPRSLLGLVPDPRDRSRRLLMSLGVNVAEEPPTLAYAVRESEAVGSFNAPFIAWEDKPLHDLNRDGYRRLVREQAAREAGGELTKANDFLDRILAPGPMASTTLERLAAEAGISERTLKRARSELGCKPKRLTDGTWMVGLAGAFDPPPTE